MTDFNQLNQILDRIAKAEETKEDINLLRLLLRVGDGQNLVQLGKYNVNIGEGKNIQMAIAPTILGMTMQFKL